MSNNKLAVAALITVAALAVTVPFIGHAENSGSALSQNLARTEMTHNVDATVGSADDEPRVVSLQVNQFFLAERFSSLCRTVLVVES
jgi:hypothetical protein